MSLISPVSVYSSREGLIRWPRGNRGEDYFTVPFWVMALVDFTTWMRDRAIDLAHKMGGGDAMQRHS